MRQKISAGDCKCNKYCEVYPGAEGHEDGVEEAGCDDVGVEMRERSLSRISKILKSRSADSTHKTFRPVGTKHHGSWFAASRKKNTGQAPSLLQVAPTRFSVEGCN